MAAIATKPEPKLVDAKTAAEILGCSVFTVRRAVKTGALPAVRFTPRANLRMRVEDLEALTSSCSRTPDTGAVDPEAAPAPADNRRSGPGRDSAPAACASCRAAGAGA